MKVFEVFKQADINLPILIVTDHVFQITCSSCNETQTLNQCSTTVDGEFTRYACKNRCGNDLATVYKFGTTRSDYGSSYRLKDYVIKTSSDLYLSLPNGVSIQLPK